MFGSFFSRIAQAFREVFSFSIPQAQASATLPSSIAPPVQRAGYTPSETVVILAKTLYGEARSEGSYGMQAVANVVINRYKKAKNNGITWWGTTVKDICLKRYQFSVWNAGAFPVDTNSTSYRNALTIAQKAVDGTLPDLTNNADHYYATYIKAPSWAVGQKPVARIGVHIFYNLTKTSGVA